MLFELLINFLRTNALSFSLANSGSIPDSSTLEGITNKFSISVFFTLSSNVIDLAKTS